MTTAVTYAVVHLRAVYEDDLSAWVAVGRYERDGDVWQSFGGGVTALEAHLDLVAELQGAGLDFLLVECDDTTERRELAWSAKQHTLKATGIPVREVPQDGEVYE